ncbi:hypothetical protein ACFU99_04510, partial [Streptomyces sp. NPDC057654]
MPTTSDDRFTLHDAWHPSLKAGRYDLTITHEVDGAPLGKKTLNAPGRSFDVRAPRLSLDPTVVTSVYPAPGVTGDFSPILPHVCLERATLPWERDPKPGSDAPWLALLIL